MICPKSLLWIVQNKWDMFDDSSSRSYRSRRSFLKTAGVAATAGLAGCSGGDGTNTITEASGGSGDTENTEGATETEMEGGVEADADTVVTMWSLLVGGDGVPFENIVRDFNEQADGVAVEVTRVPWEEYYDRLFTSMTGGDPPDLAIYHTAQIPQFVDSMVPLDDHMSFDPYLDNIAASTEFDGKHVSAPMDAHPVATYYNKELYAEVGYEEPPTNWDEFVELNDALVDEGYGAYDAGEGIHALRVWLPWVAARGTDPLPPTADGAGVEPNFNNEDGLAIMESWETAYQEKEWAEVDSTTSWEKFQQGEHAAVNDGTWAYSRYKEGGPEEPDFEWGIYNPCVAPGKEQNKTLADSHTLGIPRNPDRDDDVQQAAIRAIKYITQERNTDWGVEAGHLPATEDALNSDELRSSNVWDKSLSVFYEMASNDQFYYQPPTTSTGEYTNALIQNVDTVRAGEKDPKQAIEDAAETISNIQW